MALALLNKSQVATLTPDSIRLLLRLTFELNGLTAFLNKYDELSAQVKLAASDHLFAAQVLSGNALKSTLGGQTAIELLEKTLRMEGGNLTAKAGLAFLCSISGEPHALKRAVEILDQLRLELTEDSVGTQEYLITSRAARLVGDAEFAGTCERLSINKLVISQSGKEFLTTLSKLKNLPVILRDEQQRHDSIRLFEENLERFCDAKAPEKSEKRWLLESLLDLNHFYLPYLTTRDHYLLKKYTEKIYSLKNFFDFDGLHLNAKSRAKRIGVVSTFRYHSEVFIFRFLSAVIKSPDYEVCFFNVGDRGSLQAYRNFIGSRTALDIPLDVKNFEAAIDFLRNQKLDAVFFPEVGMSSTSRLLSMYRLARLQFTSWLHPVSSASPHMDLYFSSDFMEPTGAVERYSEKLIRLPGVGQSFDASPILLEGLKNTAVPPPIIGRLVCMQTIFKVPPFFDDWLEAICRLQSVKEVFFLTPNSPYQTAIFSKRVYAISGHKIQLIPRMPRENLYKFLTTVDLALDVPSWSGGNTTIDCLRVGCPVVGFEGDLLRSRHTYGIYRRMGLEKYLIARTSDEYIDVIERLTTDRILNINLRKTIKNGLLKLQTDDLAVPNEVKNQIAFHLDNF